MSSWFIRHIREQILDRRLIMADLHVMDEESPLAYWQEIDITWIQALQSPEWIHWRKAILDELSMLGSIVCSISTL